MNKMSKMSVKDIKNRISFLNLIIKYSSSKGLNKLNFELLEKLKDSLTVLEMKKNQI